jgi:hypothetical protein
MSRFTTMIAATALLCFAAACEKEEKKPEPTAAPSAAAAPAPTPAPAPAPAPAATQETIPVAADFEEEAEKTITKANYKSELDSLEKEMK